MPTTTTTYSFNKPVVGADEDDWGGYLNGNWDSVDDLLDGTTPITGIDINSGTLDGVTIGGTTAGAGTFTNLTATGTTTLAGASTSANITFGDNDKAIFGAGSDLQIYHDGSNSYIDEAGTGTLRIRGYNQVRITDTSDNIAAIFKGDAEATLFHNNSAKLATTSTGIDVTGTVTADGLTVEGATAGLANFYRASANANFGAITFKDTTNTSTNAQIGWNANELRLDGTNTVRQVTGGLSRMLISSGGDISFYEDTGTTAKFFWDASAERLGIGTTSPTYALHTLSSSGAVGILESTSGSSTLYLKNSGSTYAYSVGVSSSSNDLRFLTGDGAERMRIDSSGNVGIGTSSPTNQLHVASTANSSIRISAGTSGNNDAKLVLDGNGSGVCTIDADKHLTFTYSGTERLRIDSSGNLLVGTTTTNTQSSSGGTNTGTWINSAGIVNVGSNSNAAAYLNRQSTDGDIAVFRKDGSTVGSIGTLTDDLSIGNLDTGLIFQGAGDRISPFNPATNTYRDAAIDLGYTTRRFKDLYLSGGVFLGGTGSSNKLDDYEEGNGTPSVGASVSGTVTTGGSGGEYYYTKIGNVVHFQFEFQVTATGTGAIRITLPFVSTHYAAGSLRTYNATFSGTSPFIELTPSVSHCFFYSNSSGNVTQAIMSTGYYYGEITYTTSA
jgi:hypothetical protein